MSHQECSPDYLMLANIFRGVRKNTRFKKNCCPEITFYEPEVHELTKQKRFNIPPNGFSPEIGPAPGRCCCCSIICL